MKTIDYIPQHWDVTNEQYHADLVCDSNSTLNLFLEDRRQYSEERVLRKPRNRKYSLEKSLGSALHIRLLPRYPHEFDDSVVWFNAGPKSKGFLDAVEGYPGKIVLPQSESDRLDAMERSVRGNNDAMQLIDPTAKPLHEYAVRFLDHETDLPLKVMFDVLWRNTARVVDIKTISPSKEFRRALWELGYYRQAGLYCRARDLLLGDYDYTPTDSGYSYVVVQNDEPFYSYVHHLGLPTLELGRQHLSQTLRALYAHKELLRDTHWDNPGQGVPTVIDLEPWCFNKELNL